MIRRADEVEIVIYRSSIGICFIIILRLKQNLYEIQIGEETECKEAHQDIKY